MVPSSECAKPGWVRQGIVYRKEGETHWSTSHRVQSIPILVDFNTSLEGIFFFNSCKATTRFSLVWSGSSNVAFHLFMSSTTTTLCEKKKGYLENGTFSLERHLPSPELMALLLTYELLIMTWTKAQCVWWPQMMGNCLKAGPAYCRSGGELHLLRKVKLLISPCQTPLGT